VLRNGKKQQTSSVRSLITKIEPQSPISEQYRAIRTNLQFASIDKQLRTILITSANPSEGKSTTIANLAIVLAQQGNRVLLVDADLRKPSVHYTFRCQNTMGLTSVLTKQVTLDEAITSSEVENLTILTSGPIPPNPSELLGSKAMELLLKSADVAYDFILLDTPPVLAVTDAQLVANLCDGVILVISSGKTEVEQGVMATEILKRSKAKILGAVLNQKDIKQSQYYYYYGEK
jgi:protein-tyrosine kinase